MTLEYIVLDRDSTRRAQAEASRCQDFLFIRTQLGLTSSGFVEPGNFAEQFAQAFRNLDSVLHTAGGSLSDVVRVRYLVIDGRNYSSWRRVRHGIWPTDGPATSTLVVYGLPDPRALASIEAIAYLGVDREIMKWHPDIGEHEAPPEVSPDILSTVGFYPAVRCGCLAFLSGNTAQDSNDRFRCLGDPMAQARLAHDTNIRQMQLSGVDQSAAVRLLHFAPYPHYFDVIFKVTAQYFPHLPPSSSIAATIGRPGNIFESEVTAAVGVKPHFYETSGFIADPGASSAARVGSFLLTGGIVARTSDGALVGPGDGRAQFEQAFKNLTDVLSNAGTDASRILMLNVFVSATTLLTVWEEMRLAFGDEYLKPGEPFPPYSAVAVTALPSFEHLVQLEAIAALE